MSGTFDKGKDIFVTVIISNFPLVAVEGASLGLAAELSTLDPMGITSRTTTKLRNRGALSGLYNSLRRTLRDEELL